MHADYNGNAIPNGTLINKVLDLKYPFVLTVTGGTGAGTYELDQYGKSVEKHSTAPYNTAIYGSPVEGDYYYRKQGAAGTRLIFNNNNNNRWELTNGTTTIATYTAGSNTPRALINHVITTPASGTGTLSYTSYNSPQAPFELHFTDSTNPFADQNLVSALKTGFGITICDSPERAQVRYQCFPPTDTAPPFRATNTGLRTVPEGTTSDFTDGIGSVEVTYASPNAGVAGTVGANAPITKITCSALRIEGGFGDNSPGLRVKPSVANLYNASDDSFFQPGGVMLLTTTTEHTYDKLIDFDFITEAGETQTYRILASTNTTL
jgi:hypothetical protein